MKPYFTQKEKKKKKEKKKRAQRALPKIAARNKYLVMSQLPVAGASVTVLEEMLEIASSK